MTDIQRDSLLVKCLEDFHRRRALGEDPSPEEYRDRLGESQAEFVDIVDASDALDKAMSPAVEDPLPRPFGRYTLLAELGRGSMGVVYEALDRELGRNVAIKILRTGFDTEPTAVERFRREAQLCAKVHHDHIVEIYDHGDFEGRPYYTMRRLHGRTLSALVKAGQAPSPRDLAKGLAEVADGLHLLHTLKPNGIVHRDVKPSNVLVEEKTGRYVLCDFGLARNFDSGKFTKTGEAVGTPLYMAPEQMLGKKEEVDARSDVYGLGATMYEALCGRPPFKTDDPSALWGMILTQRPRSLHELVDDLPSDCEKIVRKSLEKRREDRHASAAEMRDDLRRFAEGKAIQYEPPSRTLLLMRGAKRFAPAMAAGLLLAVGGFYWWTHRSATLEIRSDLAGVVAVNGVVSGSTPTTKDVSAGTYDVTVDYGPLFKTRSGSIVVKAGDHRTYEFSLPVPKVPGDPEAEAVLLRAMAGDDATPLVEPLGQTRSGPRGGEGILVAYPRLDVRMEDLKGTYRIEAAKDADTNGTIEFHVNDAKEPIFSQPFEPKPDSEVWEQEIPAVVRQSVKPHDRVKWGFYSKTDKRSTVTVTFEVVDRDVSKKLERIDKKGEDQSAEWRTFARAQMYIDNRLFTAALQESLGILREQQANARALALAYTAVSKMKLTDSVLGEEIKASLGEVPASKRAGVYGRR